jgi:hypothetical protein
MNTTHQASLGRRITVATLLAGAIAAGGLGAAATAGARPPINPVPVPVPVQPRPASGALFSAVAFSSDTGFWASWTDAHSFDEANVGALNACQNAGGSHCLLAGYAINQCVALAVDAVQWDRWQARLGPSVVTAETAALQANGGGRIATVACTPVNGPDRAFTGRVNEPQTS